jgi:hypothetical protein
VNTNLRIINKHRENAGEWSVPVTDRPLPEYYYRVLADYRTEEPEADWHFESRGDLLTWHRWQE